jgi:hypothetical protein
MMDAFVDVGVCAAETDLAANGYFQLTPAAPHGHGTAFGVAAIRRINGRSEHHGEASDSGRCYRTNVATASTVRVDSSITAHAGSKALAGSFGI